jgi:hypothetical protein
VDNKTDTAAGGEGCTGERSSVLRELSLKNAVRSQVRDESSERKTGKG